MLLSQEHPDLYKFFNEVWELCSQHMIKGYPHQYVFYLCCCFKDGCIHPLCKQKVGSTIEEYKWYTDGPPVNQLLILTDHGAIMNVKTVRDFVQDTT